MTDNKTDARHLADLLARCRAELKKLKARKDAAVAAEREACVSRLESLKDTAYQNNLLAEGVTYSCAIDAIRARGNIDALEAVRQEARAKALRKAAEALRGDVLEVQAYRAHCAHGSVNLSALSQKMEAVEESLAAFNSALEGKDRTND